MTLSGRPVPSGRTAVMADRREPPDGLDYFATPPWATRVLFVHVLPALGVEAVGHQRQPRPRWGTAGTRWPLTKV